MFFLPRALTGSRGWAPPSVTTAPDLRDGGSSHISSAFPICSAYGLAGVLTQGQLCQALPSPERVLCPQAFAGLSHWSLVTQAAKSALLRD